MPRKLKKEQELLIKTMIVMNGLASKVYLLTNGETDLNYVRDLCADIFHSHENIGLMCKQLADDPTQSHDDIFKELIACIETCN